MQFAFVFPGQGSQSVGMLGDIAAQHDDVQATMATASDVLGYDLWEVCQSDPEQRLSLTEVTQPALLACSVALWRAWQSAGGATPSVMAGHSLGEYSALVCAGSLGFEDALLLVQKRGQLMQSAVAAGEGAMAAILGLDDEVVTAACAAVSSGIVSAANFNAPGQVVIAGERAAVDEAIENCKQGGARRALPLPVSVPSHCALMQPAAEQLAGILDQIDFASSEIPVINNVDVAACSSPADIRDALVRQLYSPVRWVETMRSIGSDGVGHIMECGPGKVLAGLQKRIQKTVSASGLESIDDFDASLAMTTAE
ncbi:MAG: ACP S-malonyltransferase [Pseudomonadota bacterium]